MLYYRDYHWLLVQGYSCFHAYIPPNARARADVTWFLRLRYVATGVAWRKVDWFQRPTVWLDLSSFQRPAKTWRDLETLSFWNLPEDDDDFIPFDRGFLDFNFVSRGDGEDAGDAGMRDHLWRVAARDGRWFTVEIALLPGEYVAEELEKLPALVTSAGGEVAEEQDATGRWKGQAEVYLLENVPFGTVLVRAPRNARDVESYAIARAQSLIGGLAQPEYIEISDHSKWKTPKESLCDDIYVELHFHGEYQS